MEIRQSSLDSLLSLARAQFNIAQELDASEPAGAAILTEATSIFGGFSLNPESPSAVSEALQLLENHATLFASPELRSKFGVVAVAVLGNTNIAPCEGLEEYITTEDGLMVFVSPAYTVTPERD